VTTRHKKLKVLVASPVTVNKAENGAATTKGGAQSSLRVIHPWEAKEAKEAVIWCIVVGERTPFPVTIDETESVGALKDHIKKSTRWPPFYKLTLYKFEVKFEESGKHLEAVQKISQNLSEQTSLDSWMELSPIEGGFPKGMLHILVRPPEGGRTFLW